MKIFVNKQKKAKIRKKRRQIDQSQVSEFLNRPVKKPQDLNQNLKNSYQKKFFDGPRFEHFKKLKNLRKGKETDSILSSDHQDDEDYQHSYRKILKKQTKAIKQEQKHIKKENSLIYEELIDESIIPSSKFAKKMAKTPVKKEAASQSSISRSISSAASSKSSSQSATNTLSQTDSKQRNLQQLSDNNRSMTNIAENSQINFKEEPITKVQSSSTNIEKIVPLKIVSKVKFERQSSCELSDEPENNPDPIARKVKFVDEISKSNEQKPKEKNSILKPQKKTMTWTYDTVNQLIEKTNKNLEATVLPINRVSKLGLNSKVIVQSFYLCANHSTNKQNVESAMDFRQKWQMLRSLFQHAPCCHLAHQKKNNRSFQDDIHETLLEAKVQNSPNQDKEEIEKKRSNKRKSNKKKDRKEAADQEVK